MALAHVASLPLLLTTTPVTLLGGSTSLDTVVTKIMVTNTDTAVTIAVTLTKETGTTTTAGKEIVSNLPIPPGCTIIISGPITIKPATPAVNINVVAITTNSKLVANASGYTV